METTSRESIEHKIKTIDPDNMPDNFLKVGRGFLEIFVRYCTEPPKNTKLEQIGRIYEVADAYMSDQEKYTVCRKGCAWCCTIPVDVLPIEVDYIEAKTGLTRSPDLKPFDVGGRFNVGYCPLLDQQTGLCSIYEHRPFNCRLFAVYDNPESCKLQANGIDAPNWSSGGAANGYGNRMMVQLAIHMMGMQLERAPRQEDTEELDALTRDIREYF